MLVTLGDKHPPYSTVKDWVIMFKTEHLSTEDEEHSGRQTRVTVPENVNAILDDGKISTKKIAENLAIHDH
jgi:hypothetical protein